MCTFEDSTKNILDDNSKTVTCRMSYIKFSPIALNWAGLAQQKCTSVQNAKVFNLFSFFTVKRTYLIYSENSTVPENVPDLSS